MLDLGGGFQLRRRPRSPISPLVVLVLLLTVRTPAIPVQRSLGDSEAIGRVHKTASSSPVAFSLAMVLGQNQLTETLGRSINSTAIPDRTHVGDSTDLDRAHFPASMVNYESLLRRKTIKLLLSQRASSVVFAVSLPSPMFHTKVNLTPLNALNLNYFIVDLECLVSQKVLEELLSYSCNYPGLTHRRISSLVILSCNRLCASISTGRTGLISLRFRRSFERLHLKAIYHPVRCFVAGLSAVGRNLGFRREAAALLVYEEILGFTLICLTGLGPYLFSSYIIARAGFESLIFGIVFSLGLCVIIVSGPLGPKLI